MTAALIATAATLGTGCWIAHAINASCAAMYELDERKGSHV